VNECYMCDASATSEEHVPPECFFPKDSRTSLITVPSCAEHNEANSKDVEYVRNVISTQRGTNEAAAKIFETTKRSFDHSPRLAARTFRTLTSVMIDGEETGAYRVDLPRHRRVRRLDEREQKLQCRPEIDASLHVVPGALDRFPFDELTLPSKRGKF